MTPIPGQRSGSSLETLRDHVAHLEGMRDDAAERGSQVRKEHLDRVIADYESYIAAIEGDVPDVADSFDQPPA